MIRSEVPLPTGMNQTMQSLFGINISFRIPTFSLMVLCLNRPMALLWALPWVLSFPIFFFPGMNGLSCLTVPLTLSPFITVDMSMIVFLPFASPDHIAPFLNYLNSQHSNINFTQETEVNNCLPFLDILITRANCSFITSVFHKPTFTGLYNNYNSFLPSVYKTGLISSLLNRYFSICSSYFIFDSHPQNLKKTLLAVWCLRNVRAWI